MLTDLSDYGNGIIFDKKLAYLPDIKILLKFFFFNKISRHLLRVWNFQQLH